MAYGCKQCVGKLKEEFAEKYDGEFLCKLGELVVGCNPETDVVEDNDIDRMEAVREIGLSALTGLIYKCKTIEKRYTVPTCSFGGHPHSSISEFENDDLREGTVDVYSNYSEEFLKILKDITDNDGFELIPGRERCTGIYQLLRKPPI